MSLVTGGLHVAVNIFQSQLNSTTIKFLQLKQFTIYDGVFSIYLYMEKESFCDCSRSVATKTWVVRLKLWLQASTYSDSQCKWLL